MQKYLPEWCDSRDEIVSLIVFIQSELRFNCQSFIYECAHKTSVLATVG